MYIVYKIDFFIIKLDIFSKNKHLVKQGVITIGREDRI